MNKKTITGIISALMLVLLIIIIPKNSNAIYSYDNETYDANDYYELLEEHYGTNFVYQFLEKTYFSTKDVEESVMNDIKETETQLLEEANDEESKKMLEATLRSFGYRGLDELNLYLKNSFLRNKMIEDNFNDYFKNEDQFLKEFKPRYITHVLIRVDEEEVKLTEAIEKEMVEIDKALEKSEDIKIGMLELNDGEKIIAEDLGYIDANAQLAPEFLVSSMELEKDEMSGWVKTDFGFHKIYMENTSKSDLTSSPEFIETVLNTETSLSLEIILDQMRQDGVKIEDELYDSILEMAGL